MNRSLGFRLDATSTTGAARAGTFETAHGTIRTPVFMPVGTVGSVKAVPQQVLKQDVNAQIILGNTYHLYLRPGTEVLTAAGGLHRFNGWDRPILTDSGGYQVFSLAASRKITEEGVTFQSHIDGSRHLFSPEKVMDIERAIGADIIMAFDECPPYPSDRTYAAKSLALTNRWLDRCIQRLSETTDPYDYPQYLFPIVQGGTYEDLRRESCAFVSSREAAGNAIGGLSVGEPEEMLYDFTQLCCENLPASRPRYLMGVGTPWNLLEGISRGVDMFDCVMPTRNGRNGMLFTTEGVINIRNRKWATDFSCIDPGLPGGMSRFYSKSYLRHLFVADELLAFEIASVQNLSFYVWLMEQAREQILAGTFESWKSEMLTRIKQRL